MTSRNQPAPAHCARSLASSCPKCHFFSAKHRSISSESAATPGKTWENFPFGFKLLFHVTYITLVLKDPERIHLSLHCFLNESHEGLMNDCDEEDTHSTDGGKGEQNLRKSRTQELTVYAIEKGRKTQHPSRDLSYQQILLALSLRERQYGHENSCCFTTHTLTHTSPSCNSATVHPLKQPLSPESSTPCIFIALLLLFHSFCG